MKLNSKRFREWLDKEREKIKKEIKDIEDKKVEGIGMTSVYLQGQEKAYEQISLWLLFLEQVIEGEEEK